MIWPFFSFRSTEGLEQVTDGNGAGPTAADYPGYDDWTKDIECNYKGLL